MGERFRVPDVVIVRGGRPAGRIITSPPEIAVEVLSPDDRAADVQDKIDDYLQFGIPAVWLIDPERQRAWIHTKEGARGAGPGAAQSSRRPGGSSQRGVPGTALQRHDPDVLA
jgi:Uma2 family endonuclease